MCAIPGANQTEQSIEGQVRVCSDFCQRHGFRIIEIYADRATSASKDIEACRVSTHDKGR